MRFIRTIGLVVLALVFTFVTHADASPRSRPFRRPTPSSRPPPPPSYRPSSPPPSRAPFTGRTYGQNNHGTIPDRRHGTFGGPSPAERAAQDERAREARERREREIRDRRARMDQERREREQRELRERLAREAREARERREANNRPTTTGVRPPAYGGSYGSPSGSTAPSSPGGSTSSSSSGSDVDKGCLGPADSRRPSGTCLVVEETRRGNQCGNPQSVWIKWRNRCTGRMYTRICFERPGKDPDCGADSIAPGGTKSMWTCEGTGRYTHDAVFSEKPGMDWVCSDWHK